MAATTTPSEMRGKGSGFRVLLKTCVGTLKHGATNNYRPYFLSPRRHVLHRFTVEGRDAHAWVRGFFGLGLRVERIGVDRFTHRPPK